MRSAILAACTLLGAAAQAADEPIRVELTYKGEVWRNARGGLATGERYLDNFDLIASGERLLVAGGLALDAHLYVLYNNHASLTEDLVGDLQTVSNIDAPEALRLYEAWVQTALPAVSDATLRFGLYDLNSEFDALATAGLFIGSSHGIGPDFSQSGDNGPSIFPVTGLAARLDAPLGSRARVRAAVLDAVPGRPGSRGSHDLRLASDEGALLVGEIDGVLPRATRAFVGAWLYTERAERLDPSNPGRARASGAYAALEGALREGVRGFVRVGVASDDVHLIDRYVGAGLTWEPHQPADLALGLAIAHAMTGAPYRSLVRSEGAEVESAETALELTARLQLPAGFVLQPDLQLVLDPGANAALDDAFVVGLRLEWTWSPL